MEIKNKFGEVLHIIFRKQDAQRQRTDIVQPQEFIQVAALKLPNEKTFRPHKHLWSERFFHWYIPQESWVVVYGNVKVDYYDEDGNLVHQDLLTPGDVSITLRGGHNYTALGESMAYEFKTGPYMGQEIDKKFIDECDNFDI